MAGWALCTMERHPRKADGTNVTLTAIRGLSAAEARAARSSIDLMSYVSAHALTEPVRKVGANLGAFIEARYDQTSQPDLLRTQADETTAYDNFLNQLPLLRTRMLRNLKLFASRAAHDDLSDAFQAEYEKAGAWRILYELRNSTHHALLPTSVIQIRTELTSAGATKRQWRLMVDHWRSLHSGFPPVLDSLPAHIDFWETVQGLIAFADDQMCRCLLSAGEEMDEAAMRVLSLVGEALATAPQAQEIGVLLGRFPEGRLDGRVDQFPLDHIQCGEVLLNTDQARETAGLPRRRAKPAVNRPSHGVG